MTGGNLDRQNLSTLGREVLVDLIEEKLYQLDKARSNKDKHRESILTQEVAKLLDLKRELQDSP